MALQHIINHISLVVDRSGSMAGRSVVEVFDKQLERLKTRSVELSQETRISIYLFDTTIECLVFDMDVMRFTSLRGYYKLGGSTALIDGVLRSVEDNRKLPELYGDHAFLQYILTDGMENASRNRPDVLAKVIGGLPENWTVACLVPDATGKFEAKKFGIPGDSIAIWDTSGNFEEVGKSFTTVVDNYMAMRSTGVRGTKAGLFDINVNNLDKTGLVVLHGSTYDVFPVRGDAPIKEYVEAWTKEPYVLGSCYYQPAKPVVIQDHKHILVQDTRNGKVYEGSNLRQVLGLPATTTTVNPVDHKDWRVFIQSTSVNRKLINGTFVLVRK